MGIFDYTSFGLVEVVKSFESEGPVKLYKYDIQIYNLPWLISISYCAVFILLFFAVILATRESSFYIHRKWTPNLSISN